VGHDRGFQKRHPLFKSFSDDILHVTALLSSDPTRSFKQMARNEKALT
jgi:hypothetical protein